MPYTTIDVPGDLAAKPGTKEWAIAVRLRLQNHIARRDAESSHITPYLKLLETYGGYQYLEKDEEHTFSDIEEFINAPYPFGLDGKIEKYGTDYKLKPQGRPPKEESKKPDNSNVLEYGNSKEYIIARLERDNPEILEKLNEGEYKSPRQAGIAAGFVKDRKYIQVAPNPVKIAKKLKAVLTNEEINQLIELLAT